jgi:O-antigen/teichoic acid export membrane protein
VSSQKVHKAAGSGSLAAPIIQTSIRPWNPISRAKELVSPRAGCPSPAALFDQALASVGSFVTTLLVAQHLAPRDNGAFALLMDAGLLLNSIQAALILYPLTIRAAVLGQTDSRLHCGASLCLTALLLMPLAVGLFGYGLLMHVAEPGLWAAAALCTWQVQETLRRTMLARRRFSRAIPGDAISYIGQAAAVALCIFYARPHVASVFAIMTASSGLAAAMQGLQVEPLRISGESLRFVAGQYWTEGKWAVLGALTAIPTTVGYSFTLAHFHGLQSVGQYQALSILLRPVNPVLTTLAPLIVIAAARESHGGKMRGARRSASPYILAAVVLLAPFYALLWLRHDQVMQLIYGKTQTSYLNLGAELRLFIIASCATSAAILLTALLNGATRSRRSLAAQFILAACACTIALPLAVNRGLHGLLVGAAIANGAWAGALFCAVIYTELNEHRRDRAALSDRP